jgi:hypothetical protein
MKIKVASYLMGIPPGNTNTEKPAIIVNFIEGVWRSGDDGTIVTDYTPVEADVAVVQGYVHPGSKTSPHLNLRKQVFEKQKAANKRSVIVDSNLFLYADPGNTKKFLRYSYDGIFPRTGEYCNSSPDPARWDLISKRLGIKLQPEKTDGKNILICCQRDGGWSMNGRALATWLVQTIMQIRKHSSRRIVVRFHPGDKNVTTHKKALARYRLPNVEVTHNDNILQDFKDAWAVVNYNSSPGVAAAIEGLPIFVLDPVNSQAKEVANTDISKIESPVFFDREHWIRKMAQMHWSLDELKDGTAWTHLRQWAKK